MNYKKFLGAASTALLIVIVVTLALSSSAWAQSKFKTLHKFTKGGKDGYTPFGTLVFDGAGNLYGTTFVGGEGGANAGGTVYKLTPSADGRWTETVLHSFIYGQPDGREPAAGVTFDQAGNLYGTTQGGGGTYGTVFEMTPNEDGSWTEALLHLFGDRDGVAPEAGLIFDQAGNLYGTTAWNGIGGGTAFKLSPNLDGSWSETVLYYFCSVTRCTDGANPFAGLIFDSTGSLYGTARARGNPSYCNGLGCGVVFKLTPNQDGSWSESVLYSFKGGKDGGGPLGSVIFDANGNLYGTTGYGGDPSCGGGNGCGVVFKMTPNGNGKWSEKVLHRFTGGKDGAFPSFSGGLILDHAGSLYGTTQKGGNLNCGVALYDVLGCGVVFKLAPNSNGGWHETVVYRFAGSPGADPFGGLIFDEAGNLYGTTAGGWTSGDPGHGSVFEITP